jgi:LmbE family N-acetylglucosaminyl deacetylase
MRNTILRILALLWGEKIKIPQNAIIISPHPDDEALGCGGLISHLTSRGCNVSIIMLTGGEKCGSAKSIDSNILKKTRRSLTKKACSILGITEDNIHFLDFTDGSINIKDLEINKLREILYKINPEAIFIPHLEDGWNDHVQAHLIVKDLLKGYSTKLYAYCVWFWYTMPFKKAISLKWDSVRYFDMNKHERKQKSEAIDIYMNAKSPEGVYYSGELPKILIKSCLWKQEVYFYLNQ